MAEHEEKESRESPESREAGAAAPESKGSFNASAPDRNPPPPPPDKPEEPPPEKDKKPDGPPDEASAKEGEDSKLRSRLKARLGELQKLRGRTRGKLEAAEGNDALKAVHEAKDEELGIEEEKIEQELAAAYFAKMAEAFPDGRERERLMHYMAKYTPAINEKAPGFADWWVEQPRHFESLYGLYLAFASKKLLLEDFLDWTDWDKKEFVGSILKFIDEEKQKAAEPPPEAPPAKDEPSGEPPPANGKPLPEAGGDAPRMPDPDDMQAFYDRQRAQAVQNFRDFRGR